MKWRICLLAILSLSYCNRIQALTALQQQAKEIVEEYYSNLQEFAENAIVKRQANVLKLFDPNGSVVNNDLNGHIQGITYTDTESEIGDYLATIIAISSKNTSLKINGVINESSFVELDDPDIKEQNLKVVWVTVNKNIIAKGNIKINEHLQETFKIKNGRIQTICTPEKATSRVNTLMMYNEGDDEGAYYAMMKQIEDGTADDDTYYYLGLMFFKPKKNDVCKRLFPSEELRKKLCTFYWMKSKRGQQALFYYGVHQYYISDNEKRTDPFPCGLMLAYKGRGEKFGYLDKNGKVVIPYKFRWALNFMQDINCAIVMMPNGLYGLIDTKGNFILQPKYQCLISPSENLWPYQENNLWGFLDSNGNVAIKAQYDNVLRFRVGLSVFRKNNKCGAIDHNNNVIIPAVYDNMSSFFPKKEVALVYMNGKCGVIDKKGNIVVPIDYDDIDINDGLSWFKVKKGDETHLFEYNPSAQEELSVKDRKLNINYITH